jgi:molecular chaperone GrpE
MTNPDRTPDDAGSTGAEDEGAGVPPADQQVTAGKRAAGDDATDATDATDADDAADADDATDATDATEAATDSAAPTGGPSTADATDEAPAGGATGDGDGDADATGDGDGDADLQAAADALEVDLELLLAEREQYLDAYRRAQADFENYRKQAQKRQDDAVVRSLGSFVEGLLPVLDSCDAALAHGASEVEPVLSSLYGALRKEGLERIDPKGATFDPAEAEAVVHEPGEGGEHVVAEVLRPGYRWRGRVLRPAMVKVTD